MMGVGGECDVELRVSIARQLPRSISEIVQPFGSGQFITFFSAVILPRAEYDSANNSIDLHLHLGTCYKFHNGALHPSLSWKESVLDLTVDRRKTLGDLRRSIFQVFALLNKHLFLLGLQQHSCICGTTFISIRNFPQYVW